MSRPYLRHCGVGWLLAALTLSAAPSPSTAQAAATVPILDPVYQDLARLESLGLITSGWTAQRPWSVARVLDLAAQARTAFGELSESGGGRPEAASLLSGIEDRFGTAEAPGYPVRAQVDAEVGGGVSPGRGIPAAGVGRAVDAVVDPLWSGRGGRACGDEGTLGVGGTVAIAVSRRWAVAVGGRASVVSGSGALPGRRDGALETAYVRGVLGPWAVQMGRDAVAWSWTEGRGLLLSENGPPVDMIRVSTDRPLSLGPVGALELSVLAADLGPNQNFPHTKLFGMRAEIAPATRLVVGLSVLNKQLGEGAPDASTGERIRDLTVLWGLFRGDDIDRFSDKLAGLDVRARLGGAAVLGSVVVTDFDRDRVGDVMDVTAAYEGGIVLPRLGADRRHEIGLVVQRVGPLVYRHHQFRTGLAVDGFLQAWTPGPGSRSLIVRYGRHAPTAVQATVAIESSSIDPQSVEPLPTRNVYRSGDLPDETRLRGRVSMSRSFWDHQGGAILSVGVERVWAFDFQEGAARTNAAVALRLWRDLAFR